MVAEKLTYQDDICHQVEDAFQLWYDWKKEWPPAASHGTDTCALLATFGNVAVPEGSPITQGEVLNLIQSQALHQEALKKGNCHWFSNKRPEKNKNGQENVSGNGTQKVATAGAHKT
ncbi:hypothetical protein MHU86_3671 [Fragilaria crotonensis]|nr:hypothetical protein MHU86_3671 [Fragilaria crotonensis]